MKREGYIQMLAERLSFSEKAIYTEIRKFQQGRLKSKVRGGEEVQLSGKEITAKEKAQRVLLRLILEKPKFIAEVEKLGKRVIS